MKVKGSLIFSHLPHNLYGDFHFQPFVLVLGLNEEVRQIVDSGACIKASLRALLDIVPNRFANVSNPANFLLFHIHTPGLMIKIAPCFFTSAC